MEIENDYPINTLLDELQITAEDKFSTNILNFTAGALAWVTITRISNVVNDIRNKFKDDED